MSALSFALFSENATACVGFFFSVTLLKGQNRSSLFCFVRFALSYKKHVFDAISGKKLNICSLKCGSGQKLISAAIIFILQLSGLLFAEFDGIHFLLVLKLSQRLLEPTRYLFSFLFFQEKMTYFPVCVSSKKRSEDETEEGLGSLPRNISSVSSLLLFNTTENL